MCLTTIEFAACSSKIFVFTSNAQNCVLLLGGLYKYLKWPVFIVLTSDLHQILIFAFKFYPRGVWPQFWHLTPCTGVKLGVKIRNYLKWLVFIVLSSNLQQIHVFEFGFEPRGVLPPFWHLTPMPGSNWGSKSINIKHGQFSFNWAQICHR